MESLFRGILALKKNLSVTMQRQHVTSRALFFMDEQGNSLMEMLVVISIVGLMSAMALPNLNRAAVRLSNAAEGLASNISLARANAISRGARYRLTFGSDSYTIQRLQDDDNDDNWEPDGDLPPQEVALPSGIVIRQGVNSEIEFTTRGLLAQQSEGTWDVILLELSTPKTGESRNIEVWPSGQVERS